MTGVGSDPTSRNGSGGITPDEYRAAMRRHAAGVTVITLDAGSGPVGFTATSFTSLSAEPPLVCFNIAHTSSSLETLRRASSLVIHLLDEHQLTVAERFSRTAAQRFADQGSWARLATGEPVLTDADCWMRVTIERTLECGDHMLIIGLVVSAEVPVTDAARGPLLYHAGQYHKGVPARLSRS